MLPTSHYDKAKADRAVKFIENLCHTKGKWAGKRFWLLPWQEQQIGEMDLLTIGTINDMYTEMQRDEEPHDQLACRDDFDRF